MENQLISRQNKSVIFVQKIGTNSFNFESMFLPFLINQHLGLRRRFFFFSFFF